MVGVIDIAELIKNSPFELTDVDKAVLNTAEQDFVPHSWDDIKAVIAGGDMSLLRRTPTDLRNYILWTRDIRSQFGSATNYIVQNRLRWTPESPQTGPSLFAYRNATPFADESDYRILRNDWPYAMMPGTVHLVVWSKTPVAVDAEGDPTPDSRRCIIEFLERTFGDEMRQRKHVGDNILWFRNRTAWQSVRSLEHIHVILRDVDEDFVTQVTGQRQDDAHCRTYSPVEVV
ncbi:GIG1 family protein [Aspergillus candidus]|uniref:N-acetylglucosamine-induced protein 1 n=1 Tax=Aspergillus candidus TaxID=41067 RepID=A0A2I2F2V2_ASPCN|nr:hypothetical protein BDW47DRAFT_133954 [Aspergillus candidus]PLB34939.1 hypothetical protein BDW47DRAFT_133954 [Aspergillus candidus]